jgi:hypothetical protein
MIALQTMPDQSRGILGVPDSTELWQKICEDISDEILKKHDLKILLPSCGNAVEAYVLIKRMLGLGFSIEHIKSCFYLIDSDGFATINAIKNLGFLEQQVYNMDFLNFGDTKNNSFDFIIGNPPFSNRVGNVSSDLDSKFVIHSLNFSDRVVMILRSKHFSDPRSIFRRELFKTGWVVSLEYIDSKYFPSILNTETCVITIDKNHKGLCKVKYANDTTVEMEINADTLILFKNEDFAMNIPNNMSYRFYRGKLPRKEIVDDPNGADLVEILGKHKTEPKIRKISPDIEKTGLNQYGVIMNDAATWDAGFGKIMIKPYNAAISFAVVFLKTETYEESVALRNYLMRDDIQQLAKKNRRSFHNSKQLFSTIPDMVGNKNEN